MHILMAHLLDFPFSGHKRNQKLSLGHGWWNPECFILP